MACMRRLWLILGLLAGHTAPRAAGAPRTNAREACRLACAGAYLEIYDEMTMARQSHKRLQEVILELERAEAAAAKAFRTAKEEATAGGYDFAKAIARDQAEAKHRALVDQLSTYKGQAASSQAAHEQRLKDERKLRQDLEKVFVFERLGDKADGGYPFVLQYRAACPKYRALCPLPKVYHEALAALRLGPKGELPEACTRYLGLSRLP